MSTQNKTAIEAAVPVSGDTVEMTYREAINAALMDEMAADPAVLLMGEDVASDGGVYKTNAGLLERFGPQRVMNTPICENTFTGVALGMSLMGMRPVVEFMFSDFLPTAADAIVNQLPKYRYMSGGTCFVPVTILSASGATGRFGTQHSATGESWYMGLPGLRVVTASTPDAAYSLLRTAVRDNNPVIFHMHKGLWGRKGPVTRGKLAEVGRAAVLREGGDVTILATMLMVHRALEAANTLATMGIEAEVIDMRWIRPLDMDTVRASVGRTGRLLVVEEQVHNGGWGATVISRLAAEGTAWRAAPMAVSLPDHLLIPYSPNLEDQMLPSAAVCVDAARGLCGRT